MIDIKAIRERFEAIGLSDDNLHEDKEFLKNELRTGGWTKEFVEFVVEATSDIPALLNELEAAQNAQRWIPVTERLPEKEVIVLLFLKSPKGETKMTTGKIYSSDDKRFNGEFCIGFDQIQPEFLKREVVTHWMPLPKPPKGESRE